MSIAIGDPAFSRTGRPGVIQSAAAKAGKAEVEMDPSVVKEAHRHGYLKGISPEDRASFNQIMDNVQRLPDPNAQVQALQAQIGELEENPTTHNQHVVQYLRSELFHIMDTHHITPKAYSLSSKDALVAEK
jgi:hypothetical protein